jgi:hypothetical protein
MSSPGPNCTSHDRRRRLLGGWPQPRPPEYPKDQVITGLDEVEVGADQRTLRVSFLGPVPRDLQREQVRIEGGRRVRGIRVLDLSVEEPEPGLDERLIVRLDRPGDFSTYHLRIVEDGPGGRDRPHRALDPRYAELAFSFKLDCPTGLDCAAEPCSVEPPRPGPEISYLAKDYEGFRALMLDRLALTIPAWRERHVPDLGVTLVELLAFHADRLSYLQDAVAAEAYLETARRRTSVRRHLRLVGYRMHEGVNARAFVRLNVSAELTAAAGDIAFITRPDAVALAPGATLRAEEVDRLPGGERLLWFEPLATDPAAQFVFHPEKSCIDFWTWGESACCMPAGTTSATLKIDPKLLTKGEILILREAKGPRTGLPEDANPLLQHPVRLTRVTEIRDPLVPDVALAEIEWATADALPFDLCLALVPKAPVPAKEPCSSLVDLAVALGNVVLVDHGRTRDEPLDPPPESIERQCVCGLVVAVRSIAGPWRPRLQSEPVTQAAPLEAGLPACRLLDQDPADARPALRLDEAAGGEPWAARADLLASGPDDPHFVLEPESPPTLRFGDGQHGRAPEPGLVLTARYRVGDGSAGNVPADAIGHLVFRRNPQRGIAARVTNPLPARCGRDPEPLEQARQEGPFARRRRLERAILADDYARIARDDEPDLQGAAAQLVWNGSWYTAKVALDPRGTKASPPALLRQVTQRLERARRIGHDLEVETAVPVPLHLQLLVCARPEAVQGHIRAAVLEALGSGLRRDGRPSFFHPDRLELGSPVRASAIVAEVMALPGVLTCRVDRLSRLDARGPDLPPQGVLQLAPLELARLTNDPSRPEEGRIRLDMGGGR